MRKFFAITLVFALIGLTPLAPSHASDTSVGAELVDSLVVKYEPGAVAININGEPTGTQSVSTNIQLNAGENLGLGYHTIDFDRAITVAEANEIAKELAGSNLIASAEPNKEMRALEVVPSALSSQINLGISNWNLDILDEETTTLDGSYEYQSSAGAVNVYVVDSGIRASHNEFNEAGVSRVKTGRNFAADQLSTNTDDCNSHGTHVAGIIAGETYGVSKLANIYPVRVLSCDGSGIVQWTVDALTWIVQNYQAPAVVNMSIGTTGDSPAVNALVAQLVGLGVPVVAASGNGTVDANNNFLGKADACTVSPAKEPAAITVNAAGALDSGSNLSAYSPSYFSNYGSCTDIYAPGYSIKSASRTNDNQTETKSGTSMAAPLVTGVIANILAELPNSTPAQIKAMLDAEALNVITSGLSGDATLFIHQPTAGWATSTKSIAALSALNPPVVVNPPPASGGAPAAAPAAAPAGPAIDSSTSVNQSVKRKVISISTTAPAGSAAAVQILTTVKKRVAYKKGNRTLYRTTSVKSWRTVSQFTVSGSNSVRVNRAGTYRVEIITPSGTATGPAFRVR
jgi:subtilisin family serine protease